MTSLTRTLSVTVSLFAGAALAQTIEVPDWENSVRFQLIASQDGARPGDRLELAVVAEIDPGYHLYGPEERKPSRTEVLVQEGLVRSEEPVFPPVVTRDLAGLGKYDLYEGKIAIRIPITVDERVVLRQGLPIDVRVNYQVCTDSACSAPTHKVLSLVLPVVGGGAAVQSTYPDIFRSKE
ncbi:MAG: protein-disulfide reductase DsbD N-terminal domain-containing protein [Vicinamibacteria bacterium]